MRGELFKRNVDIKDKNISVEEILHAIIVEGKEVLSPVPVAVTIGMQRPPTLQEQLRRVMRQEARANHVETVEEALDFDVEDEEPMPMSEFEVGRMIDEPLPGSSDPENDQDPADPPEPDQEQTQ